MPFRQQFISDVLSDVKRLAAFLSRRRLAVIFGLVYAVLSLYVMAHFLYSGKLGDVYYRARYDNMYHGTAWKPFVYRQLVPKLTKGVVEATPAFLRNALNSSLYSLKSSPPMLFVKRHMPWTRDIFPGPHSVYPRLITILLIYGSLGGYIWALRRLAGELFPGGDAVAWFAPIFGMLAIPSFSVMLNYLYDIPVLFLSAACFYFLLMRKWKAYLFVFLLACLNKETSIFLLIFSAIWLFSRMERKSYLLLIGVQCLIWVVIKVGLVYAYWNNPGPMLEDGLTRVLASEVFVKSRYHRIVFIAAIFFLLTYGWTKKPAFLKTVFWVAPLVFAAFLLYGWPGEYRVFFDIMPLLVLLLTHTLVEGTGIAQSPVFARARSQP